MANHELYVVQGKTLDNIAGTMRAVLGVDKDTPIRFDEVASSDKTEQINADVETQTDLIAQIKTALNGKAGSSAAEIGALIDESKVLGTTDETVTVTEKVEKLIDLAKWKDQIQQSMYANNSTNSDSYISVFRNTSIKDISMFDYSQRKSLQIAFSGCSEIENIEIDASSAINIQNMCAECKKLKSVKFTKSTPNISNMANAFRSCISLERVETMNFSSVTNFGNTNTYPFVNCSALKELRVDENSIKVSFLMYHQTELSADSIQSIFGGLNSEATGQTLTLKLTAVKKAFETSEGANDGDTSAAWSELVASKPNWTITLS